MKPSADSENAGLPMTSKWDPEKPEQEIAALPALEQQPFASRPLGYLKRTGPGLLQSAMTLGAGSAVASVVAGASFGYQLLWVQPVAMFLGVCMLAALGAGWRRAVFNTLLAIAVAMSVVGAGIQIKSRVLDKLPELIGGK